MQFASTTSASEKPHQKPLSGADRSHRFVSLPVHGITPRHSLVFFVGGPVNIPHVMIADKDPALFGSTHRALALFELALDQQGRNRAPSPNIGASVEGIAQNVADQALRGNLPDQTVSPGWGWQVARRRDHGTIEMFDARSTVLETWRTRVESLRRPVDQDEKRPY